MSSYTVNGEFQERNNIMSKYKAIVIAVVASTAFALHAEECSRVVESGPPPSPYGVKVPVPTPADFKFAVFPHDPESGPQPAPFGVKDPEPTPADFKFAVFPHDPESGPQPAPSRVKGG